MIRYLLLCLCSLSLWSNNSGRECFLRYCGGCHSTKYGVISAIHKSNLDKIDAERWFGRAPPDLSLITLQYSKKWLEKYLLNFYPDKSARFGVNNHIAPDVLMPQVLLSENEAQIIAQYLDGIAAPERKQRHVIGSIVLLLCSLGLVLATILSKFYQK